MNKALSALVTVRSIIYLVPTQFKHENRIKIDLETFNLMQTSNDNTPQIPSIDYIEILVRQNIHSIE